jgi:hypothetical protein
MALLGAIAMNRLAKALVTPGPGDMGRVASPQDQADLAAYIVEMTGELARLAGEAGMPMLAYFLNLARVEAQITVRENDLREPRRGL